jgi:hypothetical protein
MMNWSQLTPAATEIMFPRATALPPMAPVRKNFAAANNYRAMGGHYFLEFGL